MALLALTRQLQVIFAVAMLLEVAVGAEKGGEIRGQVFTRLPGRRLETNNSSFTLCSKGVCSNLDPTLCLSLCYSHPDCRSVNYQQQDELCEANPVDVVNFGYELSSDSLWNFYRPFINVSTVTEDDWILAFRAVWQINVKLTAWDNTSLVLDDDLNSLDPAYYSHLPDTSVTNHYRTHWLDVWSSTDIEQVRFSLYANGTEVVRMVFNGTGSDNKSWFSEDRLLECTPWEDINTEPKSVFSLNGELHRMFYVMANSTVPTKNCPAEGWLSASYKATNACDYDKNRKYPMFYYAKANRMVHFENERSLIGMADVLAVFIKLSPTSPQP